MKRQEVREALLKVSGQIEKAEESSPDVMEQVRNYLEEHFAESELSLSAVAEIFFLNPSYLSRAFRKRHGMTLVECLNKIRLEKACDYLRSGDFKAYEVAEKVGIPNPDYFGRCFRKYTGMSVNDYKKKVKIVSD